MSNEVEYTVTFKWSTRMSQENVVIYARDVVPATIRREYDICNWLVSITREEVVTRTVEVFPGG